MPNLELEVGDILYVGEWPAEVISDANVLKLQYIGVGRDQWPPISIKPKIHKKLSAIHVNDLVNEETVFKKLSNRKTIRDAQRILEEQGLLWGSEHFRERDAPRGIIRGNGENEFEEEDEEDQDDEDGEAEGAEENEEEEEDREIGDDDEEEEEEEDDYQPPAKRAKTASEPKKEEESGTVSSFSFWEAMKAAGKFVIDKMGF